MNGDSDPPIDAVIRTLLARPVVAPATLYVVATPIGNLGDITLRGLATLAQCTRVLCEDTRVTARLLNHFGLKKTLVSCYEQREAARIPQILDWLKAGESLTLVSDAGTPAVSDPGARIVAAALAAGIAVEPVPGASALTAALAAAGLDEGAFTFHGFAPRRAADLIALLAAQRAEGPALIFYESPHRIHHTLAALRQTWPQRRVVVLRELTKLHAQRWAGTLAEFSEEQLPARGEIVLIFPPPEAQPPAAVSDESLAAQATALKAQGLKPRQIAAQLALHTGLQSADIYRRLLAAKSRNR